MRICYVADALSMHVQRQANFFAQEGHEVHLISTVPNTEGYDQRVKHYPLGRVLPRLWWLSKYLNAVIWLLQIRRIVRSIKPDVLDAQFITVNGYLGLASGFHPLILTAMGSDILLDPGRNPLWKVLTRYCLKKADFIICRATHLAEEISKSGVHSGKIKIVRIGVDTAKFHPRQRDNRLRQTLGIDDSCPLVISTRNLEPIYNVETLIQAMPLVLAESPNAKLVIVGRGRQEAYLKRLAESLQIASSVRFISWIPHDELPEYLASADIYVSTSLSDGASNSLLEAMASGLAPIVADIPANHPWIKVDENGLLFPTGDYDTLAKNIVHLIRNYELRKAFGKKNREIVQERAEHKTEMKKLEAIYRELAESGSRSSNRGGTTCALR